MTQALKEVDATCADDADNQNFSIRVVMVYVP